MGELSVSSGSLPAATPQLLEHSIPFAETKLFHLIVKVLSSVDPLSVLNSSISSTSTHLPPSTSSMLPRPTPSTPALLLVTPMLNTSLELEDTTLAELGDQSKFVFVIVIGTLFAILTTVGNLMVMVSFKIDRQLQTISNYFLFSLAVADITIGAISIPLMTYYTAMNYWGIGYTMCQFWLCIDYLMSNASVLNLLLISFDRYFSVTRPLTYRPRRTTKKAMTMIASTYIISLILWPPWIISWPYIEGKFTQEPGSCVVQFLETNPYVTVGTAVAAFYLPVTIMIVLYSRVYWETRKRQREFAKLQAGQRQSKPKQALRDQLSSISLTKNNSLKKKPAVLTLSNKSRRERHLSWLKRCAGRRGEHSSSELSSEVVVVNVDDTSLASCATSITGGGGGGGGGGNRKSRHSPPLPSTALLDQMPDNTSADTMCEQSPRPMNGSGRFRTRVTDRPLTHSTYTVLIELGDKFDKQRPSVRLSSFDLDAAWYEEGEDGGCDIAFSTPDSPLPMRPSRLRSHSDANARSDELQRLGLLHQQQNGQAARVGKERNKQEKERRKNERKQESKAAKTLSAILFAFIVTWTPYNLIVCWEAFFPNSIPDVLFTISYCLCYINSTINPLCYALCNARFRTTYIRILKCRWKQDQRSGLVSNAYVRR